MNKKHWIAVLLAGLSAAALAKLPPLSDEAKAKAAEAAAKTAWSGKVDGYLLCKSQDKVAAHVNKGAKKDPKAAPAPATPPCADPGPFVYPPVAGASAPAAAASATKVAAAAAPKKKP